jgi:predicted ATPase
VLRELRIQNFKAWQDTRSIRLAPLTVLFGANSSGKSSINHLLMLLRQTSRSSDRGIVLDFGGPEDAVQLGSFRDAVYDHDVEREIRFELEWDLPATLEVRDPRSRLRFSGTQLSLNAAVRQSPRSRVVQSEGFAYSLIKSDGQVALSAGLTRDSRRTDRWKLEADDYPLVRNPGRAWELPKPVQFYGFPQEALVYYQNTLFLTDLELSVEEWLSRLSYLGPIRSRPERLYTWTGGVPEDVGWEGQNTIQAILAAAPRGINWTPKARRKPFEANIAEWLVKMGLIHSFAVESIAPDRDLYEVRVRSARRSAEVKLTDVGFGVSQVLPVITQAFYAPPRSTVLMEQPELHLHPSVQASLADLLLSAISSREDGSDRRVQFIVESHSEHLLRRLLRRVAEEEVDPDVLALYFCYASPHGSVIRRLEVDEYGDVLNWPDDFFGDELEDVAEQAKVGMQRRLKLDV